MNQIFEESRKRIYHLH